MITFTVILTTALVAFMVIDSWFEFYVPLEEDM